jgi:all-trans-retinol dehydrogenase (NAD+)
LITGAARGIGQATALELARAGANTVGIDLQLDDLQETAEAVAKTGRMFKSFACDVSDEAAARKVIAEVIEKHGGFDVLINNAGVAPSGPFIEEIFPYGAEHWMST